jgi:ABC-type uncharacterized transport system substrate-binding protein
MYQTTRARTLTKRTHDMPFILARVPAIAAANYWANRARNSRDVVGCLADMADAADIARAIRVR